MARLRRLGGPSHHNLLRFQLSWRPLATPEPRRPALLYSAVHTLSRAWLGLEEEPARSVSFISSRATVFDSDVRDSGRRNDDDRINSAASTAHHNMA